MGTQERIRSSYGSKGMIGWINQAQVKAQLQLVRDINVRTTRRNFPLSGTALGPINSGLLRKNL